MPTPTREELAALVGERVRREREQAKWSQEKLGRATELSRETIRNIENGHRLARMDTLETIASALSVEVWKLLPWKTPSPEDMRSFFSFAHRRRWIEYDPAVDLHVRKRPVPPAPFHTPEEIVRLVYAAACRSEQRGWTALLFYETGGRLGSLAAVRPEDAADHTGGLIHFRVTKGDRPQYLRLTPWAAEAIRELRAWSNGTLLGVGKTTIWSWINQAAKDAGFPPGRRHPHLMRHTFATILYRRTTDPLLVAEALNHADLSQIKRYASAGDEKQAEALAQPIASALLR